MMRPVDFMRIAQIVAERSTCKRLDVGAVLTVDRRVISIGYNGAPSGAAHCNHGPDDSHPCGRAVHAEANTVAFAARHGIATDGSVLYTTILPCYDCAVLLINAGVKEVYYRDLYREISGQTILEECGVKVEQLAGSELSSVSTSRGNQPSVRHRKRPDPLMAEWLDGGGGGSAGGERGENRQAVLWGCWQPTLGQPEQTWSEAGDLLGYKRGEVSPSGERDTNREDD